MIDSNVFVLVKKATYLLNCLFGFQWSSCFGVCVVYKLTYIVITTYFLYIVHACMHVYLFADDTYIEYSHNKIYKNYYRQELISI